jgi:hypothetical protein
MYSVLTVGDRLIVKGSRKTVNSEVMELKPTGV